MSRIEAVFFDAGGTLFELRRGVGEVYSDFAAHYGAHWDPAEVDTLFQASFARSLAGLRPGETERGWWFEIVRQVAGGRMSPDALECYFAELYDYFRTADAWRLYPEVTPSLKLLTARGLRLGMISNFDSRLEEIAARLGIGHFFESIVTSWDVGAPKPDPKIFLRALELFRVEPSRAVHVGDSAREDVSGARASGLEPVLIDRAGSHPGWSDSPRIRDLSELSDLV